MSSMLTVQDDQMRRQFTLPALPIGPMRISDLSAVQLVEELIEHGCGNSMQHVVTANAQYYVLAEQDRQFRNCIAKAEYVCPDGISVVMACRLLTGRKVPRIAGVDLIPQLCEKAASVGLSVYFLGGRPGAAARTASLLQAQYPDLRVAGVACPPFGFSRDPKSLRTVLEEIRIANPSIIFVALGVPFQDYFIEEYLRPLDASVAIGVGGSFDIIAGVFKRAPELVQRFGLEWLFRLLQEPRRLWRRYFAGNAMFSYYVMRKVFSRETDRSARDMNSSVSAEVLDQEAG